jgi:acetyl/propionyl-CoA carboxylase alpha subunit
MNTRLQVEHGITELCYDVDLVELMLKQADAQFTGKGGLSGDYLKSLQPKTPQGHAIEARVYAENPVRDYAPSPGLLQKVEWEPLEGSRIDTWVSLAGLVREWLLLTTLDTPRCSLAPLSALTTILWLRRL